LSPEGQGHLEWKCKNCISSSKVDRFTSNQDQNYHWPILHILASKIASFVW